MEPVEEAKPRRRTRWRLAALAALLLAACAGGAEPPAQADAEPFSAGRFWMRTDVMPTPEAARLLGRRNAVNAVKLAVALAGCGVLLWGAALRRAGRPAAWRRTRDGALATLGLLGLLGWWNFLHFHYPIWLHDNNVFVYYVGAKYFPELGYTRLYECTALADFEAGLRETVQRRRLTDLESYEIVGTRAILADPGRCRRHFSAERWQAFRHDVAWFRARLPPAHWERIQRDHGYNPSPVWGLAGTLLANTGSAGAGQIIFLTLLDPLLELLMWAAAAWAFGWRATCVALVYWGTNFPAEFSWTGGSYLRHDWLAASVVGVALLRRGRSLGAGFLLGWATLLRVFPAFIPLGVGLAAGLEMLRRRRFTLGAPQRRLVLGGVLALATLVPASIWVAGGSAWPAFVGNARLHVATPGDNLIGLRTLLAVDPQARLETLARTSDDPARDWKQARRASFERRRPVFYALVAGFLALLVWAVRGQPDWVAGILGMGALPVLLEPTCYYTSALVVFAFLWTRRESVGIALLALSAASWGAAALFFQWDDLATALAVPLLGFVVFATLAMGRARRSGEA